MRQLLVGQGYAGATHVVSPGPLVVPAEPSVSLIVNVSDPSYGFVTGVGGPYRGGGADAPTSWAALTLTPLGAYRVIGPAVRELAGQVVDITDVFGAAGRILAEQVRQAPDWTRRFDLMDRFLRARVESGNRPADEVEWVWRRLVASGGRLPIRGLADEVGWSHQYLIKQCRAQLGRPLKTLARILRFKSAVGRIRQGGRWESTIYEVGYYDQAHFCRDLKEFTGTTPTNYLASALPCGCVAMT